MTRRFLIIFILLGMAVLSFGQDMSVKSFYLAENDLTANTPGTMVYDQNGNVCALIKLETTQKGFTFDVGMSGVMSTVEQVGEIWIYVPFGVRRITIKHPQLGIIRDFPLPCTIEKGRTYIMTLVAGTVRTIVEQASTKQFLQIEITPSDAILEVNGKIKVVDNGVYNELLPFGKYQYKAYCKNYHDLIGVIEVSDPDNTHRLNLKLKPAFGHISILEENQTDIKGAAVYIDEQYMGTIPLRNVQISSGTHSIRVIKELYEAYNENVVITDEEKLDLKPNLIPDFAEVTLVTSEDADIYINGELKGKHTWKGKLMTGSYVFESKQNGHIPTERSYDINRANNQQTIQLQSPTPIYGSLVISSTPSNAKISINGKQIGETPKYISKQVIGEYRISVELNGYETQTKTINVTEGNEVSLSFTLEKKSVSPSVMVAETAAKSTNARTITSTEATIRVGEQIFAKLPLGYVDKWDTKYAGEYVRANSDGSLVALKEGKIGLWGTINGKDKLFTLTIVGRNKYVASQQLSQTTQKKTFVVPKDAKVIYSKEATIRLGEKIVFKLAEGYVDSWDQQYAKEYIRFNPDGSIVPIKKGKIGLWGYINGSPKIFTLTIVNSW